MPMTIGYPFGGVSAVAEAYTNCAADRTWLAWSGGTMKCTMWNWAILLTTTLALTSAAQAAEHASVNRRTGLYEPPMTDLRKAAERGDRAELARVAARLGPARLAKALQDPDKRIVLAALDSVPLLTSGILVLESVVPLLASTDETIRGHAVATASALLAGSDGISLADWEVAGETVQATCRALAAVAANEAEPLPSRLTAIQGLSDSPVACAPSRKPAELLSSHEPEIRRATVLALLPNSLPMSTSALLAAAQDRNGGVAAAAGARLCERRAKNQPLPTDPPLRKLALAEGALPEDVMGMLPCLAASADPADRKAVEELQTSGSSTVREAARRLQEKATSH